MTRTKGTLGLIGGIGPEATIEYYQAIVSKYQDIVGSKQDLPEMIIYSINMYKMYGFLNDDRQDLVVEYIVSAIDKLHEAGADFVAMSGNTPHVVFDEIRDRVDVPMVSIVEETFHEIQKHNLQKVGLIGTRFTMRANLYAKPFVGTETQVVLPDQADQEYIDEKITEELFNGVLKQETKDAFIRIITNMIDRDGIEGIILGCTEIPLLIKADDLDIFSFDTAEIHINNLVDRIIKGISSQ